MYAVVLLHVLALISFRIDNTSGQCLSKFLQRDEDVQLKIIQNRIQRVLAATWLCRNVTEIPGHVTFVFKDIRFFFVILKLTMKMDESEHYKFES